MNYNWGKTPIIAITGSAGKTTTREILATILETKWKVLKTTDNNNLPNHHKALLKKFNSSYQAIVLEMGMGTPGAAERHCTVIQPNISIITNVGTAHYGNLGNSIESTARHKSELIKYMDPGGIFLKNNDDPNSDLLDTTGFKGKVYSVGTSETSDYRAENIQQLSDGISFEISIDDDKVSIFIPVFGYHNVFNALLAIATAHILGFSGYEIKQGLSHYEVPNKRLKLYHLKENSLLFDDTANSNPEAVKKAIDVVLHKAEGRKKIVVLGSMLELGDYEIEGHMEVGRYIAQQNIDEVFLFGKETEGIKVAAINGGFPAEKIHLYTNKSQLNDGVKSVMTESSILLVKGSSKMRMDQTVKYIKNTLQYRIFFDDNLQNDIVLLNQYTLDLIDINSDHIELHFGTFTKKLAVRVVDQIDNGKIIIPKRLNELIEIPELPYEYYLEGNHLHLGPVIGVLVLPRYIKDPEQQMLRFSEYDELKGLIYLCNIRGISKVKKTVKGLSYNPKTKSFQEGVFPYPNAFFNRLRLNVDLYRFLKQDMGGTIFNFPYDNTDKWAFHKRMSTNEDLVGYLPETIQYTKSRKALLDMLNNHTSVYIKPTTTAGGHGILHIEKIETGFIVKDYLGDEKEISSENMLFDHLATRLDNNTRNYIIQQDISYKYNEHKVDFRIYIQKNDLKDWIFSGLESKIAKKGSIISNSKNREAIKPGKDVLTEIYGLSADEADLKIEEVTEVGIKILKILEKKSHLGDAAIDFLVDENNKVWILEVQINYAAEIKTLRDKGEQQVLPSILPTPLKYAKSLTGF